MSEPTWLERRRAAQQPQPAPEVATVSDSEIAVVPDEDGGVEDASPESTIDEDTPDFGEPDCS